MANEDARNDDTVTGRALGTVAAVALTTAAVVGGGAAVYKGGKKAFKEGKKAYNNTAFAKGRAKTKLMKDAGFADDVAEQAGKDWAKEVRQKGKQVKKDAKMNQMKEDFAEEYADVQAAWDAKTAKEEAAKIAAENEKKRYASNFTSEQKMNARDLQYRGESAFTKANMEDGIINGNATRQEAMTGSGQIEAPKSKTTNIKKASESSNSRVPVADEKLTPEQIKAKKEALKNKLGDDTIEKHRKLQNTPEKRKEKLEELRRNKKQRDAEAAFTQNTVNPNAQTPRQVRQSRQKDLDEVFGLDNMSDKQREKLRRKDLKYKYKQEQGQKTSKPTKLDEIRNKREDHLLDNAINMGLEFNENDVLTTTRKTPKPSTKPDPRVENSAFLDAKYRRGKFNKKDIHKREDVIKAEQQRIAAEKANRAQGNVPSNPKTTSSSTNINPISNSEKTALFRNNKDAYNKSFERKTPEVVVRGKNPSQKKINEATTKAVNDHIKSKNQATLDRLHNKGTNGAHI